MTALPPFGSDELDGVSGLQPDELAAETRLAREVEGVAARSGAKPGADFTDRVMVAVAAEPVPSPAIAAGSALRHGAVPGLLASIRDAFRVTFSGGFPLAIRAQALALVLLVVGITAGSGYATAGALGILGDHATPSPAPSLVTPTGTPAPTATPAPSSTPDTTSDLPSTSPSDAATETPEASDTPEATEEPGDTVEPDDHGGGGGDGGGSANTPSPTHTTRPTANPTPDPTGESHENGGSSPTHTPHPTDTPSPSPTTKGGD
jgi:hypothetical protein